MSRSLWIYFVTTLPLTAAIVGLWCIFDQRHGKKVATDGTETDDDDRPETEEERERRLLERRIMRNIQRRTGLRVANTFDRIELQAQPQLSALTQ